MISIIRRKAWSLVDDLYTYRAYRRIFRKYQSYTMIRPEQYTANLAIAANYRSVPGCVVECGTWRGGMIAGLAEVLGPDRHYYLFDSFEGLPPAAPVDGASALAWQKDTASPDYHDNCTAPQEAAQEAMAKSGAKRVTVTKGWFDQTLRGFRPDEKIALLRLDADWFASTLTCLESLYTSMSPDGVILLDDYYIWDGCARAVHYFLAKHGYAARVHQPRGICAIKPNFSVDPVLLTVG